MTDSSSTHSRLVFLDSMRGFAALWVVLHHFSEGGHMPVLSAAMPHALKAALFDLGNLGVPVFFVLSGVVMAFAASCASDQLRAHRQEPCRERRIAGRQVPHDQIVHLLSW